MKKLYRNSAIAAILILELCCAHSSYASSVATHGVAKRNHVYIDKSKTDTSTTYKKDRRNTTDLEVEKIMLKYRSSIGGTNNMTKVSIMYLYGLRM